MVVAGSQQQGRGGYCVPRPVGFRLRRQTRRVLARCASLLVRRGRPGLPPGLGILTYHRIAPRERHLAPPTWNVTPAAFARQLAGLIDRGFRPLALREALACSARGHWPEGPSFVVTFDDGYANVYQEALPVLRHCGVPATLFLATAYLDREKPFPFEDWLPARGRQAPAASWRPLRSGECRELLESGLVELGSHTHSHRNFLGDETGFREDLARSLELLQRRFGVERSSFSFPFGALQPALVEAVREAGICCALTTRERLVCAGDDPFLWGRFNVESGDTPGTLAAKLDGRYAALCTLVRRLVGTAHDLSGRGPAVSCGWREDGQGRPASRTAAVPQLPPASLTTG